MIWREVLVNKKPIHLILIIFIMDSKK